MEGNRSHWRACWTLAMFHTSAVTGLLNIILKGKRRRWAAFQISLADYTGMHLQESGVGRRGSGSLYFQQSVRTGQLNFLYYQTPLLCSPPGAPLEGF